MERRSLGSPRVRLLLSRSRMTTPNENEPAAPSDFIRDVVAEDLKTGRHTQIHTRFPPEPNGYLHIGHAKAICLNFGIAHEFGGVCNIRMDDTNPAKEEVEYVDSIMADAKWLIDGWADDNLGLKPAGKTPEKIATGDKVATMRIIMDFVFITLRTDGFGRSLERNRS